MRTIQAALITQLVLLSSAVAQAETAPDADELLQKAIQYRLGITSGEIEVWVGDPKRDDLQDEERRITMTFDGGNVRLVKGLFDVPSRESGRRRGSRIAGFRLVATNNMMLYYAGAKIQLLDRDDTDVPVPYRDPRALGMNPEWWGRTTGPSTSLGRADFESTTVLSTDEVHGHRVWKVRAKWNPKPNPSVETLAWIDPRRGFSVLRIEHTQGKLRVTAESWPRRWNGKHWYPERVVMQRWVRGELNLTTEVRVLRAVFDQRIDSSVFSLAGLNVGLGTQVTDRRAMMVAGYWDGNKLVRKLTDVPPAPWTNVSWIDDWGVALLGALGLGVLAGYAAYRYRVFGSGAGAG